MNRTQNESCTVFWASLVAQMVKNLPAMQETWVGKIPWRSEQLPTPVFWPGEFHGQRSLAGYSPWGRKELDTTEQFSLSLFPVLCRHEEKEKAHSLLLRCLQSNSAVPPPTPHPLCLSTYYIYF